MEFIIVFTTLMVACMAKAIFTPNNSRVAPL